MHGAIFVELQKYVSTKLGEEAWPTLLSEAGLAGKAYEALEVYPDEDALALVTTASKITGTPAGDILTDFGEFIVPDLLEMFWSLVDPAWKTLDFLAATEETIHKVVRLKSPGATPPKLRATRNGANEVVIEYDSDRKMCALAKGLIRGVAKHYEETVAVSESQCMGEGAAACKISVKLA
jgi:predicted hydrocarbon binding protein